MNKIDRTHAPKVSQLALPKIEYFETEQLTSGATLHLMRGGSQPITQIIFNYNAGRYYQGGAKTLASNTINMLFEGTTSRTTQQISSEVEYYGADLSSDTNMEFARISLSAPTKFISNALDVVSDCLLHPTFPQKELTRYKLQRCEQLKYNLLRSEYVVGDVMRKIFYPADSVFYDELKLKDIRAIKREQLIDFHQQYFSPKGLHIFVSGQPDDEVLAKLRNIYSVPFGSVASLNIDLPVMTPDGKVHKKRLPQSTQTTVMMSARAIKSDHPDFIDLQMLVSLFGGYFGSRLMKNIREDKGLTYGIQAFMRYDSVLSSIVVQSSVDSQRYQLVIDEIHKEMQRLIDEPVGEAEMEQLKAYCRGSILSIYSDIFNAARNLSGFVLEGATEDLPREQWKHVDDITPERLQQLAAQFLRPELFHIAVAGNV